MYNALPEDEKNTYDLLYGTRHNQQEIDQLINRYNVIKGEILIGNDNLELLKELRTVILRLVSLGILTTRDISNLLEQIFYIL